MPSNLERESSSWRSIEFTESPVWVPPADDGAGSAGASAGMQQVVDGLAVYSCYDSATKMVTMDVTFAVPEGSAAYGAIGWRESDECLMNPRGGGSTPVVFAAPDDATGAYAAHFNMMAPDVKTFSSATAESFVAGLTPLDGAALFSNTAVEHDEAAGTVKLSFDRDYSAEGADPAAVHLTFAIGNGASFAYHKSRGCFALTAAAGQLGSCSTRGVVSADDTIANLEQALEEQIQECAERRDRQNAVCSGFGARNGCNGEEVCCSGTCRASQCAAWEVLGAGADGTVTAASPAAPVQSSMAVTCLFAAVAAAAATVVA